MYPIPFRAEHVRQMPIQPAQAHIWQMADDTLASVESRFANTLVENGLPVASAGAVELTPGRAHVWGILSERVTPQNFRALFAYAKIWLRNLPFHRLEASVDLEFGNGHRLMKALGFYLEVPRARAYRHDRRDASLYTMVK